MTEIGCPDCGRPVETSFGEDQIGAKAECAGCGATFDVAEGVELGAETAVLQKERPRKGAILDLALVGHLRVSGSMSLEAPLPLRSGKTIVGREDTDIVINDATLSARHFEIENRDGQYSARDLGSTNGTLVNGNSIVQPVSLKDGDRIEAGKTTFVFRTLEAVPWTQTE